MQSIAIFVSMWVCMSYISKSSSVAETGDRLATIDKTWAEKWGIAVPLSVGELSPHLIQCRLALPPYQVAS